MGDKVFEAAGRTVERLSRRRFVGWMGKGGLALAAGLGLDALRSDAFAQEQPQCASITKEFTIKKGAPRTFEICTTHKGCAPAVRTPKRVSAADLFCLEEASVDCKGVGCKPTEFCDARARSLENVNVECHPAPAREQDCGEGETKCVCTVRARGGFKTGKIVCQCQCLPR